MSLNNLYINDHRTLFTIAKDWKQSKCLSFNEWISKNMLYPNNRILFSYKMNKVLLHATTWVDIEKIR